MVALPAAHNFPLGCPGLMGTLAAGGRVVMAASPKPEDALAAVEAEGVTTTALVPALAIRWLEAVTAGTPRTPGADRRFDLSSLEVLQVGGARLVPEVARRIGPAFGCRVQQVFGMAEGLLNFTRLEDPDDVVVETQGRPMSPADEILIVGPDGEPVADGEPGELLTRGPYTIRGYYRAEAHYSKPSPPRGSTAPATWSGCTRPATSPSRAGPRTSSTAAARRSRPRRSRTWSWPTRGCGRRRRWPCPTPSSASRRAPTSCCGPTRPSTWWRCRPTSTLGAWPATSGRNGSRSSTPCR